MIYILTGDIRTGKTSALLEWVSNREDVDGVLCPDGENGKRYFLKVKSQKEIELEVVPIAIGIESEKMITIGRFHFLKSAFEKANEFLVELGSKSENQYLIIDELGKLELKHKGLHPSAETLIPKYETNKNQDLILVVRDYLVNDILRQYSINEYSILKKDDLKLFG